jgi:hypothetical protein
MPSNVPALIRSGDLDPVTPSYWGRTSGIPMKKARHIQPLWRWIENRTRRHSSTKRSAGTRARINARNFTPNNDFGMMRRLGRIPLEKRLPGVWPGYLWTDDAHYWPIVMPAQT